MNTSPGARASRGLLAIIGGGIVGLATAWAARRALPDMNVMVLEKEDQVGVHQSGRNSGVVHSGVYYRPGTMMARLCVEGARAMAEFCGEHDIPFVRCGKVIVATDRDEVPRLEEIHRRGVANGVTGLERIGPERLREIEPAAQGVGALHVPGAAITDFGAVTRTLARLVESSGGVVRTRAQVLRVAEYGGDLVLETTDGTVAARRAVNCAGLHSDRVARLAGIDPGVAIVPFRGEYYELAIRASRAVRGLIYPVPVPGLPFLGVHLTKRVDGGVTAGPNAVLALRREGYRASQIAWRDLGEMASFPGFWRLAGRYWRDGVRELSQSLSQKAFLRALRRLTPDLTAADLRPRGSGVRAQAVDTTGRMLDDFHMVPHRGMLHVLNVPSPAATASLPIGSAIVDALITHTGPDLGAPLS